MKVTKRLTLDRRDEENERHDRAGCRRLKVIVITVHRVLVCASTNIGGREDVCEAALSSWTRRPLFPLWSFHLSMVIFCKSFTFSILVSWAISVAVMCVRMANRRARRRIERLPSKQFSFGYRWIGCYRWTVNRADAEVNSTCDYFQSAIIRYNVTAAISGVNNAACNHKRRECTFRRLNYVV